MAADRPAITLRPDPAQWRAAIAEAQSPSPHAADRHAVGLPTDRPIVMSGHQPLLWHAGILAKLLAAAELAAAAGAHAAWIVPDMDEADPTTARVPKGRAEQAEAAEIRLLAGDPPKPGVPAGSIPARAPLPAPNLPGVADALARFQTEPSLAMQAGRAAVALAAERFGLDHPTVIPASALLATRAWAELLAAIRRDPAACVAAYNAGASAHPEAGVRPLAEDRARVELPLWRVRPDQPRLPVFSDQLDQIPPDQLRPRALAMTAICRAALCDLFIHGLGGEKYDRVTESWLAHWSDAPHAPAWTLAPTAVATADARVDLGIDPGTLPDPARARWRAHHARHDPAMLDDAAAARTKAELLAEIDAAKAAGQSPAPAFARLQAFLRDLRDAHRPELDTLDAAADRAERLRSVRDLALDRTWPWPCLPDATLTDLHHQIRAALGPSTIERCQPRPDHAAEPCRP